MIHEEQASDQRPSVVSAPVFASRIQLVVFISWVLPCTPQVYLPWSLPGGSLETFLLVGLTGGWPSPVLGCIEALYRFRVGIERGQR